MNYTLSQLRDRVDSMIKQQGADAHCAAWVYTKHDCHVDEVTEEELKHEKEAA